MCNYHSLIYSFKLLVIIFHFNCQNIYSNFLILYNI
nr:MAG TPA: hypothetical protein [Caudoviricetes sp.]